MKELVAIVLIISLSSSKYTRFQGDLVHAIFVGVFRGSRYIFARSTRDFGSSFKFLGDDYYLHRKISFFFIEIVR